MPSTHKSLALAACLAGLLFGLATAQAAGNQPARPDILLVMPDQMRGDCMSGVGHPVVRTPQLDALAAEARLSPRYSSVPSCIPARFALLTGQSSPTSGVVGYAQRPITVPTLPAVLAQAGYTTVLAAEHAPARREREPRLRATNSRFDLHRGRRLRP